MMHHESDDSKSLLGKLANLALVGNWEHALKYGVRELGGQHGPDIVLRIARLLRKAQMIDAAEAYLQQGSSRWPEDISLKQQGADLATH